MGEDMHVVIEHRELDGSWNCAMELCDVGRGYEVFRRIKDSGQVGLPADCDPWTRHLLTEEGLYGQGWMMMEEFRRIKGVKRIIPSLDLISKKARPDLRVIYSFDW